MKSHICKVDYQVSILKFFNCSGGVKVLFFKSSNITGSFQGSFFKSRKGKISYKE